MTTAGKQRAEAVREILCSVLRDPDRNLQKLRRAAELFRGREFSAQRQLLRCALEDPSHPYYYYGYLRRLFSDIDLDVVARLLENFCVNDQMIGREIRESVGREFGCRVPRAVFMDPSSSGGLLCAGSPGVLPEREYRLTEETMESVVRQGKGLGIYIYAFTGREPLHCAQSLIRICEAHPDCLFLIFTDGILIDWLLAEKMRRAGNVIPVVRFCGGEEETDRRHGAGTYRRVRQALEILRGKELFFGISCKLAENTLLYGTSSDFYEDLIRQGVCFLWYSMQVPDGGTVSDSVLPDLSRRAEAYQRIRRLRAVKPLPALDFQNDTRFFGGCQAGGRGYLHIGADGGIDPCCYVRSEDRSANIYRMTLLEALRSPAFRAYRGEAPGRAREIPSCPFPEHHVFLPERDSREISS